MKIHLTSILFIILQLGLFSIPSFAQGDSQGDDRLTISRFEKIPANLTINNIVVDKANKIWICSNEGLYQVTNINETPNYLLPKSNVVDVAIDRKGQVWAATSNAIIDLEKNQKVELPNSGAKIKDIETVGVKIWIGTDQGLYLYTISTGRFEHLTTKNSDLKSNTINFIHTDEKNVTWVGTAAGENRIDGDKWKNYHPSANVIDFYENKEGLWFLTPDDMWLVDYYNREYKVGLDEALYTGKVNDFAIDSKGRLYVASEKLVRYDPYEEKTEQFEAEASMVSSACNVIACDKNDNIWIGTVRNGMYRLRFKDLQGQIFSVSTEIERPISCFGKADGAAKIVVTGGKGPYAYEWNDKKIKGQNPKNLSAGTYSVTVTDRIQNREVVTLELISPPNIEIALKNSQKVSSISKKDGMLEVMAVGGIGTLNYRWSNGDRGPVSKDLGYGKYAVTVSDDNKCTLAQEFEVPREKFIPDLVISNLEIGKTLRINELNFKADSTEITPDSYVVLEEVFEFLKDNPNVSIEIGGHTNTIPPHEYCDKLSADRAKNVANFFYSKNIPTERITYVGYGKRQPLTQSESLEGRRRNQRVEIKILKL